MNTRSDFMKIRKYIVDMIATHGDQPVRFPPTRELGKMFGVSQPTALRAVKDLIGEGLLSSCRGGGTMSRPNLSERANFKIIGLLPHLGQLSFDNYFFMELSSSIGLELMHRSNCFCTETLNLETPSMLERVVREDSLSALALLAAVNPIPEFALNARKNGLPVVSFFHEIEGISSFYVPLEDRFYDVLCLLFREKRTRILIVGWDRPEMMLGASVGIEKACREFQIQEGQVITICQRQEVAYDKVNELLNFGMKFDAIVFYPCYQPIYDLAMKKLDTREECRLVLDATSVYNDMHYTGYVVRYDLKTAAKKLVDHLLIQMHQQDAPIIQEKIAYTIDFYQEKT